MPRRKKKIVRGAAVLDKWGAGGRKPQEELDADARHLEVMVGPRFEFTLHERVDQIPEGTNLLLFDYGGAGASYGPNPMAQQIRALRTWVEDHPSALVVIVSNFTWEAFRNWMDDQADRSSWDDTTNDEIPELPNVVPMHSLRRRLEDERCYDQIAEHLGVRRPRA